MAHQGYLSFWKKAKSTGWLILLVGTGTALPSFSQAVTFLQAERFDRYVRQTLSSQERKAYERLCRKKPKADPFCFTVRRYKAFRKAVAKYHSTPRSFKKKDVTPVSLTFKKNKVLNWSRLRGKKIASWIAALEPLSRKQLDMVAQRALKERRCPNQAAAATAATLEDFLPEKNKSDVVLIGKLYEKAGRCARGKVNREHFKTRAALFAYWNEDYKMAHRLLRKVQPTDYFDGRALYWRYRTEQKLGDPKAQKTLKRLFVRHPFSFHAMIASTESGIDYLSKHIYPPTPEKTRSKRWQVNRLLTQMERLKQYGFRETSAELAYWALQGFGQTSSAVRIYLMKLASPHLRVLYLPELFLLRPKMVSNKTLELAYPKAFFSHFSRYRRDVDIYLLLALARKESRFDPKAVSPAGAFGLLQLLPKTAEKLTGRVSVNLFDPQENIRIGAKYFSQVLGQFDNDVIAALSAYNAGENKAVTWRRRYPRQDPILFIDLIPFRETRNYVAYVLSYYYWYVRLYEPFQNSKKPMPILARNPRR